MTLRDLANIMLETRADVKRLTRMVEDLPCKALLVCPRPLQAVAHNGGK